MGMPNSSHPDIYSRKGRLVADVPKAETDLNMIVARFEKTGMLPPAPLTQPVFADVSQYSKGLLEAKLLIDEILAKTANQARHNRKVVDAHEAKKKEKDKKEDSPPSPPPLKAA